MVETVAEKDGIGASAYREGPKSRPEMHEKWPHRADLSSKKAAKESSVQSNKQEEETEFALVHCKRKVSVQAGP